MMALVRCNARKPDERRTKAPYIALVEPFGLSQSGVICGRSECGNFGAIWLSEAEAAAFSSGIRIFPVQSSAVKIKAADGPPTKVL